MKIYFISKIPNIINRQEKQETAIHLIFLFALADSQDATSLRSETLRSLSWSCFSQDGLSLEYNTSMGDHTMLAFAEACHLYELALKQRHQLDQIVQDTFWLQMSPHGNIPSTLHMQIKLSAKCKFNIHIRSIVPHIDLSKEKEWCMHFT